MAIERTPMTADQRADILQRLERDFSFKINKAGKTLRGGRCPNCNGKTLWVNSAQPWLIHCGRLDGCKPAPYEGSVRALYPDVFRNYRERAEQQARANKQPLSPTAIAELYLKEARGFNLELIKDWYSQESYYDRKKQIGTPTVRFAFRSPDYWERLIENTDKLERKANWRPEADPQGWWWCPPSLNLVDVLEFWLVEGIFDAIALLHHGINAVSLMTCTNYPELALAELELALTKAGKKKEDITLVWALDGYGAGQAYTEQFFHRATAQGWKCEAAQIPQHGNKIDWNDCHKLGQLEEKDIETYKYHGQLLTAASAFDKALLMYLRGNHGYEFHLDYHNSMYWFYLDMDKLSKASKKIEEDQKEENHTGTLSDEQIRDKAVRQTAKVKRIAMFKTTALYFQFNQTTGVGQYYYLVEFPHKKRRAKAAFSGSQLSAPGEFKKRLLEIAGGPVYKATAMQHDTIIEKQIYDILSVDTVDYVGYAPEYKAYLLDKVAVQNGRLFKINKDDYFNLPDGLNLKTTGQGSVPLDINAKPDSYNTEWPRLLWQAFGVRGYIALSFWFGSLFAEQIKEVYKCLTFFEITGDPGSGKTTLLNFLWKLLGRNYEGVDPEKATAPARARLFAQTSNMPVALIESDRSDKDKLPHAKSFDWDELKSYYNYGARLRARGVATSGNEVYEPIFRGAFVIAQNRPITDKEAIMQRICQVQIMRQSNNDSTLAAARKLESLTIDEVSYFILRAVMTENETMSIIKERVHQYEAEIMALGQVKVQRIALNHAQIRAMADALAPVIGMTEEQLAQVHQELNKMAGRRQVALNLDSEIVQQFWDMYNYMHRPGVEKYRLNHSKRPDETIAININHFYDLARVFNQPMPDMIELKKALKESKFYKFAGYKTVDSAIRNGSVRCYVFQMPGNKSK